MQRRRNAYGARCGADGREWTKSSEEGSERREWELAFIG